MKTDIFVGADLKPYNFHLLPPLNQNNRLIQLIRENGGVVISDTTNANAIILASRDYPIPSDLKGAYVYSYEVVVESANTGVQQNFNNYLIHVPSYQQLSSREQQQNQSVNDSQINTSGEHNGLTLNSSHNDVGVEINVDDYDFSNLESALSRDAADFNKELRQITGDLDEGDDDEEDEDDDADYERNVPELDEDEEAMVNRQQMEQLRQIQRYQEQQRQQQMTNRRNEKSSLDDGHRQQIAQNEYNMNMKNALVSQYEDDNTVRYFTEEEDRVLMEEVRKRHWMGIKGHGVYGVIAELPYFKMKRRTASSLRERMRTLKYNIGYVYKIDKFKRLLKDKNGNYIKQTNFRSKLMPFTALDDMILCKTILIHLTINTDNRGYESVVFPTNFYDRFADVYFTHSSESWRQRYKNYIQVFGIINYLKYYIIQVKSNKTPKPVNTANKEWLEARKECKKLDVARMFLPDVPVEDEFVHENMDYLELPADDDRVFNYESPFKILNQKKLIQSVADESKESEQVDRDETTVHADVSEPLFQPETEPQLQIQSSSQLQHDHGVNKPVIQSEILSTDHSEFDTSAQGTHLPQLDIATNLDDAFNDIMNHNTGMDEFIAAEFEDPNKFVDEPTTSFSEKKFRKLQKKLGDPIKLAGKDRKLLIETIKKVFAPYSEKIQPKELSEGLSNLGVEKYYLIYLTLRCNSSTCGVLDSIVNYIETDGRELLVMRPGVWSDKAHEIFAQNDPKLNQQLIAYHGEKNFKKYSKHFSKVSL